MTMAADLILTNGRVWTEDPNQPEAEAVAVSGNAIAFVGRSDDVLPLAGTRTTIVDLRGGRVVPGFNDAHVHFSTGGFALTSVDLRNARSEDEFRAVLGSFASSRRKGDWILQGAWDPEGWASGRLPTCQLIDDVTPDNPVFINRTDGHTTLANSLAMSIAQIDARTTDVPFGVIHRDDHGTPTGIFVDAAQSLIQNAIPAVTQERFIDALMSAQQHAVSYGVTSVHDMGLIHASALDRANLLRAYQTLVARNALNVRVSLHMPLQRWSDLANIGITARFGDETFRIGGLKAFADGSLGSRTAWFYDSYADAANCCGLRSDELMDPEAMYQALKGADEAGLQLAIHAIGDRANHVVLGFCERVAEENGPRDRRMRVEHAQHLLPEDFERFYRAGVIASVQPYHCIDDGRFLTQRIGPDRSQNAFAFRSLLDAGARLAFGSDWWVAPIDPLLGIYAAVTRRTLRSQSTDGSIPAQRISVEEAVHAYTVGSAYAAFDEQIKGSIEIGKLADMVVLSDDIFSIAADEIQAVKVDLTIFGGKVVYERAGGRVEAGRSVC